ncbi:conserved hypothetical protein, secreted [Candidatus Magnetomorum sp. HK-1]|nr:conserved hypothetical protein, secreted [Candidatus Magnetomorum sp. HK-1]
MKQVFKILFIMFMFLSLIINVCFSESTEEEAARRLPPVLYSLDMPECFISGQRVTIIWSILGYHDSYGSTIAFFNCTDQSNCGGSYSSRFEASQRLNPVRSEKGGWSYSNVYSTIFHYEYSFTPPSVTNITDIVVRFYRVNNIDSDAGKSGLSLLVPGAVASKYCDTSGRRFIKTVFPNEQSASSISLNVPYLDQLDIPNIGNAACASASSAMVLAYHGKIQRTRHAMIMAATTIFDATSSTNLGLKGRSGLSNHLVDVWDFSSVYFEHPNCPDLYEIIKEQIRNGRPMILGSKSMTSYGHYIVVIGYDGDNYGSAKLIVNDPNGQWNGYDSYSTNDSGKALKYDFTDITSQYTDGVFIISP